MKSEWMGKKLVLFGHLIAMKELLDRKSELSAMAMDLTPPKKQYIPLDPSLAVALEKEVLTMKKVCKKLEEECVEEAENVQSLTKLDETLKTEVSAVGCWFRCVLMILLLTKTSVRLLYSLIFRSTFVSALILNRSLSYIGSLNALEA
jgi:hypothetical protein